jgi:hypothetical protein
MSACHTGEMRTAVAAGEWPAVLRLWETYASGILEEVGRGTCTRVRMAEAREFLEWAKRMALCERAQNQRRLNAIHAVERYRQQPSAPAPSVRTSL